MLRTKKRMTKRWVADLISNMTMANQPRSIKEILDEFDCETFFSDQFDNMRNAIENKFLMIKMHFSGSLDTNLYEFTPANRPPIPSLATVTSKVNMNEPISVMRRPNQGEVALSMTGSPLMVSAVSRDDMATITVPLANGNVLSILPKVGASMDIPFNEQTKNELLLLKRNIEDLLKINRGL